MQNAYVLGEICCLMPDGLPANSTGLTKRRVTIKQIAEKAGVSAVTVDRVINGRTTVRRATALRVQSAAQALGYQFAVPMKVRPDGTPKPLRCAFLLQRKSSTFNQQIAEELQQVLKRDVSLGVELTAELMDDYLEPAKVADKLRSMSDQVDAVAVVATDSHYVSEAISFLAERQTPVVALLSDLSSPHLAGYVGINNRMAGRTAAWAIANCAAQPGTVGVLIGSHGYLGQEEREIGFRGYFREKGLEFKVLEPVVCLDEPDTAYEQTVELLNGPEPLVGLYSVGGGARGVLRAIEERRLSGKLAYVCHELTPATSAGLSAGTINVVLAHDIPALARSALKLLVDVKHAPPGQKQSLIVPFTIFTSENI